MPIRPKKKSAQPKKSSALTNAQLAVGDYDSEIAILLKMKRTFQESFPDANDFLQDILRQEDLVQDKIKIAIPLIREAKQSVGSFKCQTKQSTPNYDEEKFASLVTGIEEGGDILIELIEGGYVKQLKLDPSVTNYFAQHPDAAEHFQPAWRDAEDLTPAVTPPKL